MLETSVLTSLMFCSVSGVTLKLTGLDAAFSVSAYSTKNSTCFCNGKNERVMLRQHCVTLQQHVVFVVFENIALGYAIH